MEKYKVKDQAVLFDHNGRNAGVQVISSKIIRVFCNYKTENLRSKAVEMDKTIATAFGVEEKEDGLWIRTQHISVRISGSFCVDFFDSEGKEVCMEYRGHRKEIMTLTEETRKLLESEGHIAPTQEAHSFDVLKKMQGSEHFYGLGDKTGFLDKRHYEYEMWNTDNPMPHVDNFKVLYKSIPFFITLTDHDVFGIFVDNTYKTYFDMGYESEDYYYFGAADGNLDYYYIAGDSMSEVVSGYTYLTGTCPVPQKWTLGYHQSRWGYITQEDVEDVASKLRDNDIPCDALHFDIDYMNGYRVFTWNEDHYHGNAKGYLNSLAERGFKPVAIIDPGVKKDEDYTVYQEGSSKGYFVTSPDGTEYINTVWPGETAFPDFGRSEVRKWWSDKHQFLLEKGVRGVWNDMNEPMTFRGPMPDDLLFRDEERLTNHKEMHNAYGHLMSKATFGGLKKLDGRRPFVITRACYAGSQKYASTWTGDNHSLWTHLQMAIPQLCNLGLSGMPFCGTDVGGFGSNTTPELLVRWVEMGCFSPLFRNHGAKWARMQEPWQFGTEVMEIYRKYVKLRYHWLPYIYDQFFQGEKTGAPMMRPLVFHYENDKVARTCNDQFLCGANILIAPIVMQGATSRAVYLPEGCWYDYWTKERIQGPAWVLKEAPLDVCPIYIKAGSIIPTMEPVSFVGEKDSEVLCLEVWPGEGEYDHFLDNGEDYEYRKGYYHHYHFSADANGKISVKLIHEGYEKPYTKVIARNQIDGQETRLI